MDKVVNIKYSIWLFDWYWRQQGKTEKDIVDDR